MFSGVKTFETVILDMKQSLLFGSVLFFYFFCFLFTNSVVSRAECIILHGCAAAVAMA